MALNAISDQFLSWDEPWSSFFVEVMAIGNCVIAPPPVHKGERENSVPGFYVGIKNSHELGGWQHLFGHADHHMVDMNSIDSINKGFLYNAYIYESMCSGIELIAFLHRLHLVHPSRTSSKLTKPLRASFQCCIVGKLQGWGHLWHQHLHNCQCTHPRHDRMIDAAAMSSKQNCFFYDWWLQNALGWTTTKCLGPDVWRPQSQKSDCLKTQSPNPDCFKTQSKKNRPRTEGQSQTIRKALGRRNTVLSKI